jgi:diadenosine tetraphosphatase ApaH/serine/threonine PP2A family protein phosphatase
MTYLVISDIHANLEALEAVLLAADPHDGILVLGDLVGYGADPNLVVERVRELAEATIIRGNHDKVAAGVDSVEAFNRLAREAISWTASALTPDNRAWLAALPAGPVVIDALVQICHGTPFDEDVYVFDDLDARRALAATERPLCLFGHTHVPTIYRLDRTLQHVNPPHAETFRLPVEASASYLVNCGAVGQPRDGDPRAAFGQLDTERAVLTMRRVAYDVGAAQAKILSAGLPEVLARRLALGR